MSVVTIAGTIVAYLVVIFVLYKIFEKFFKIMFFVVSVLFAAALAYIIYKGF